MMPLLFRPIAKVFFAFRAQCLVPVRTSPVSRYRPFAESNEIDAISPLRSLGMPAQFRDLSIEKFLKQTFT
jgi:hypothetical protein